MRGFGFMTAPAARVMDCGAHVARCRDTPRQPMGAIQDENVHASERASFVSGSAPNGSRRSRASMGWRQPEIAARQKMQRGRKQSLLSASLRGGRSASSGEASDE
jgi:hypothetical protein